MDHESVNSLGEGTDSFPRHSGELQKANPYVHEELKAIKAKFPWKVVLAVFGLIALMYSVYALRKHARTTQARERFVSAYANNIKPYADRYRTVTETLYGYARSSAAVPKQELERGYVDPLFQFHNLHQVTGLYARISRKDLGTMEAFKRGAMGQSPDSLGKCFGIIPFGLGGFIRQSSVLEQEWYDEQLKSEDFAKLRVAEDEVVRTMGADLVGIEKMVKSAYMMLIIQEGTNRRDDPVSVFVWDMKRTKMVFAGNFQSMGAFISVGINGQGREQVQTFTGGANDCSIATQAKALATQLQQEKQNPVLNLQ